MKSCFLKTSIPPSFKGYPSGRIGFDLLLGFGKEAEHQYKIIKQSKLGKTAGDVGYYDATGTGASIHLPWLRMSSMSLSTAWSSGMLNSTAVLPT